jgi:peptidoglycan/xylan/chitin deacetylase (PgdA/CDA1 family)
MKQKVMMVFLAILMCFTFIIPAANVQAISTNQTGTHDGYFYSFWTNGGGSVNMTLGSAGNYSVQWSNCGDFTCGKGWRNGSGHTISYNAGVYQNSGGGALALYGWTTNPLVEYYICETQNGVTSNSGTTQVGTFTSDGGTYTIYKHQQVNQPSIQGNNSTFWQYISVRNSPRTSGTITIQNHFNAWKNAGLNLGAMDYQIMLTEGWNGSGQANVTVWEGGTSSSPTPTQTPINGGSTVQCENMSLSGQYAGQISSPFSGVALYANNDAASTNISFSGNSSITLYGASNNSSTAQVSLYIGSSKAGTFSFTGTSETASTVNFNASGSQTVKFVVETDTGSWDAYLDYFAVSGGTGDTTPTPVAGGSTVQCENMSLSGQYAGQISSPFSGVALYANNDAASTNISFSGNSSITLYGASNNSSTAQVSLYIGSSKAGTFSFTGTSETASTVNFNASGSQTVKFVVETDNGSWDAYLDYFNVGGGGSANPTPTPTSGGGGTNGSVYLCFDDGPNNSNSQTLINNLKSAGVNQATFFVWGDRISGNQTGWNAYLNSGFSIQNHSWTHSHMTGWSYQQVYNDLQQCSQAIQNAGKPKPTRVRLPYLESNSTIQSACSALGLTVVNPSVDTQDWNGANTQSIINACNNLQNGGNPLMHDAYSSTDAAIATIVQNLKNRGLGFTQY